MGHPRRRGHDDDDRSLLRRAAAGDTMAFEQLYRGHADAAWRAAQTVLANADDAADAVAEAFTKILRAVRAGGSDRILHFRAYLLTATRNAALDRRRSREVVIDLDAEEVLGWSATGTPSESLVDLTDETFVVRAFHDLPDRWRRVLWLTEVEGRRPVDAAEELGMHPNAVAQLAFRARAGLRERYLQAHLRASRDAGCSETVDRLGAHVLGRLGAREHAAVDAHLEGCDECRARRDELTELAPGALSRP